MKIFHCNHYWSLLIIEWKSELLSSDDDDRRQQDSGHYWLIESIIVKKTSPCSFSSMFILRHLALQIIMLFWVMFNCTIGYPYAEVVVKQTHNMGFFDNVFNKCLMVWRFRFWTEIRLFVTFCHIKVHLGSMDIEIWGMDTMFLFVQKTNQIESD